MNAETKLADGSRWRSSAAVCASTSAGRSESHVRASTKKRTIDDSAATSRPLPLTSPTSDGGRAARHRPRAEDVAAPDGLAGRLVDEADLQAGQRGRGAGDEAARERVGDPALALEVERVGDRAGRGAGERDDELEPRRVEPAALVGAHVEHPEQPRAEADRDVHERGDALALEELSEEDGGVAVVADVRLARRGDPPDHPLADAEPRALHLAREPDGGDDAQVLRSRARGGRGRPSGRRSGAAPARPSPGRPPRARASGRPRARPRRAAPARAPGGRARGRARRGRRRSRPRAGPRP